MAGFTFGAATTTTTAAASPFNFGAKATPLTLSNPTSTAPAGFSFGLNKTTASTGLLATPASTTTAPGLGGFGLTSTSSGLGGFGLTSTPSLGFTLGNATATTTSATGLGGFSFGKTTTAVAPIGLGGTGGLLGVTPASTTSGLGVGLFSTATTASTASSIFNTQPAAKTNLGLGGVDPNAGLKTGGAGITGSSSDGKALKESILPDQLTETVHSVQKYVKEEKAVREDIARMSSKPMHKVQEDVLALKQLLSVVANGLQRNTCSVEKLKQEMTQNLKSAEMAQRTKDIPPGLQYENTAPTEYFQRLVQEFEESMVMYRQQIEALDSHLTALHQPSPQSPAEVITLMKKLHEAFLSLAAQLQQVHEAVKSQKDQFLTYRRIFHGDSKNIFQKITPLPKSVPRKQLSDLMGPTPFPSISNAASQAMAMVLNRSQQPQGPPISGLVGMGQTGLGVTSFGGAGLFGANKTGLGFGTGDTSIGGAGSLFSSTALGASPITGGFGTPPTMGSSMTAALNLAGTNLNVSANTKQPFQLQKPPQGAKRGKR